MIKLNAAFRLRASAWQGLIKVQMESDLKNIVIKTMNDLSSIYPTLSLINVEEGDWLDENSLATKSLKAVFINVKAWNTQRLAQYAKDWKGCMVKPTASGVIVHECGHILFNQLLNKLGSKRFNAILSKYTKDIKSIDATESPSAYGQEDVAEWLAECFSAHYHDHHGWSTNNKVSEAGLSNAKAIWEEFRKLL